MPVIRDAEIETTIRTYATPLFEVADLDPSAVRIVLVQSPQLNSFVAGGQKIFIYTGLLLATDTPNQLIGVIAHETGHIAGGHLARTQEALKNASTQTILAMILGGAAAVAGNGAAAGAIFTGGAAASQSLFLQYSRAQEGVADQAALTFLDATKQSSRGLMQFLEKLGDQELLITSSQDPYVRTHPLSTERVEAIRAHVRTSPYSDVPDPPAYIAMHARMRAKLYGFLNGLPQTLRRYPESDQSVPARYARAIAYHQDHQTDKAIKILDGLIAQAPNDPYFHELKGQVLLESQHVDAAIPSYAEAVKLLPDNALLHMELGQAQVSSESPAHVGEAIENLKVAVSGEPDNPAAWRWLATAYGRNNQIGQAALATAERYALDGAYRDAMMQAGKAKRDLPAGSPGALRAEDLESMAKRELQKKHDR